MAPRVAILVLNWNGGADTLDCLASLARLDYLRYDVLLIDNGSTDGSPALARERYPEVAVLELGRNLGFTGANNAGMRWALERGADYVLLLNNDAGLAPDTLSQLVQLAEADPAVGMAAPSIYYAVQPNVFWSAGGEIDWRRGRLRMQGIGQVDAGQYGQAPRETDFLTGCALLVKRVVLERAGLLDERFFAYYEDAEWCVRVRRAGFKVVHVPRARAWHKISPEARADSPLVHYYMTRNRLLFLRATHAGPGAWMRVLLVEDLRTWLSWSLRPKWRYKRPVRRAMMLAWRDYWRGCFGEARL